MESGERAALRRRIDAVTRQRVDRATLGRRVHSNTLAERAYEAANGDPELALAYALDVTARRQTAVRANSEHRRNS